MDHPSPKHVQQVAEISALIKAAFMLANECGATGSVCCDAALSTFLAVVGAFGAEQETIDALPYIREVLEQRIMARVISEAEERHSGTVH